MQESSLKKRYAFKLFSNVINALINAVIVAIVPKALGPVAYGQFTYLQNFFTQAIGFLDMGSSIAFFTKLSARQSRKELITFYFFYSILVLLLILGFIFTSEKLNFINDIVPNISIEYIYLGLFFGFFTWLTQIFIKISDAYALTVSVELLKIFHRFISLLILLLFVYQMTFDLKLFFYYNYIALVSFLFILLYIFIKKDIFKGILNSKLSILNLSKEFISYCHPLLAYSIVGLLAGLFDIWLLQTVAGSEQMGFYGLAYSLAAMCFLFTSAMTPIITREFSKSYEQKDIKNMRKLFYRYIPMLYSIAAYFALFISIQSENIIMIFTDENFKNAFWVLVIMAFYPIHQTYGQLSGSIFYATGQTNLIRNIAFFTMPLGMITTSVCIYFFDLGAVGLAYKMIIIQFIGVNIQLYFNSKLLNLDMKYFIWHQIYSISFFGVLAMISSFIISFNSPLITFVLSGFLYTILVIIFTYIFPSVFSTNRNEIKENLQKVVYRVTKK